MHNKENAPRKEEKGKRKEYEKPSFIKHPKLRRVFGVGGKSSSSTISTTA